jgi:hypothetical protein
MGFAGGPGCSQYSRLAQKPPRCDDAAHESSTNSSSRSSKEGNGEGSLLFQPLYSSTPRMIWMPAKAAKRTTVWVGFNVHFTQTCEEEAPQLLTHVETTPAPRPEPGADHRSMPTWLRSNCCQLSTWWMQAMSTPARSSRAKRALE